ncbi:MAG: type II secretion system F family protein [Alphaproteobacteria bacterium]|nr:type II secretion system F family protein [Alphaproteobacteria bacterium]
MIINGVTVPMEQIIVAATALATFLVLFFVWRSLLEPKPESSRLKDLKSRREALREGLLASTGTKKGEAKQAGMGVMRKFVERLDLLRGDVARETSQKLARAGLRTKDALVAFIFFKIALPFVCSAVGLITINIFAPDDLDYLNRVLMALLAAAAAFFLPDLAVMQMAKTRKKDLQKGLPDALDLLVVCAQAGLSLDAAVGRVAREIGFSSPSIGEELSLTALELGFLPQRRQALENLKSRTGLKDIQAVVSTLIQSEKYGTPLAYALKVLSAEFRRERLMRAEEKAAQLPAIMTLPLALFILPVLFMVVIGPAMINAIASFSGAKITGG